MPYSTADGVYESEFEYMRHQAIGEPYETHLSASEEQDYAVWKSQHAPNDSGEDYDFRGAFKQGITADTETGHWPDTFKKPNHPTFSNESVYAKGREELAGRWNGEEYIPPGYTSPFIVGSDLMPPREVTREQAYSMGKDLIQFEHEVRNAEVQDKLDPIFPGTPYNDRPTDQALARYFNETGNAHIYGLKDEEAALEFRGNGIRAWQYKDTPGYEPDPRYYPSPPEGFRKGLQQYNREYGTPSPIADVQRPYVRSELETEGVKGIVGGYARTPRPANDQSLAKEKPGSYKAAEMDQYLKKVQDRAIIKDDRAWRDIAEKEGHGVNDKFLGLDVGYPNPFAAARAYSRNGNVTVHIDDMGYRTVYDNGMKVFRDPRRIIIPPADE